MANTFICKSCQEEIPEGVNFCPNCGVSQKQKVGESNHQTEKGEKQNQTQNKEQKPQQKEKKRPYKIEVDFVGREGEYIFDIQVLSQDGDGIPAVVKINEGNEYHDRVKTDNQGFIGNYKARKFTQRKRIFFFRVIGTSVNFQKELWGPTPKKKKVDVIKRGGFIANLKNVLKEKKEQ